MLFYSRKVSLVNLKGYSFGFTSLRNRCGLYVSVDGKAGLTELCSSLVNNTPTQGLDQGDLRVEQRFLKVNGGFLGIKVERNASFQMFSSTHYGTKGSVAHDERRSG